MTSGKRVSRSTNEYRKNRAKVLAPDNGEAVMCHWCQRAPAVEADHLIEIDRGGSNDVTNLVGSCAKCNNARGHKYQAAKKKIAKQNKLNAESGDSQNEISFKFLDSESQFTPNRSSPYFIRETDGLSLMKQEFPRLETNHAEWSFSQTEDVEIVGNESFGDECAEWAERFLDVSMMPWQLHVLRGQLAHDGQGNLLNRQSLVSVARQNGKSECQIALAGWWLCTMGARRDRPQNVVTTAHRLDIATLLFERLAPILIEKFRAEASWSYGRMGLVMPDGSKLWTRAATPTNFHGLTVDCFIIDEVWAIGDSIIDDAIIPTQKARKSALCSMWSTAGTEASATLLAKREMGLRAIDKPNESGNYYFAEYSPPHNIDPMTPEAWAYANPALGHTLDVETLRAESLTMQRGSFLRATCNVFVSSAQSWLDAGLWETLTTDIELGSGGVLAVDQSLNQDRVVGLRAKKIGDETIVEVAFVEATLAGAWNRIEKLMESDAALQLAIGAGLEIQLPAKLKSRTTTVGHREMTKWTAIVRQMIKENRVKHHGELLLNEHVARAVPVKMQSGLSLSSTRSPGAIELARCLVFAVAMSSRPVAPKRAVFASS